MDPMDITLLIFAWHCQAQTMCEFTHSEFTGGLVKLNCDSLEKLRAKMPLLKAELRDDRKFRVRP